MESRFTCVNPWSALRLQLNGGHAPCCVTSFCSTRLFPKSKEEMMRLFNSPEMVELREKLLKNDLRGTPCLHCVGNVNFGKRDFSHFDASSPHVQHAERAYREGHTVLDYTPLCLSFISNLSCNLQCVMCTQSRPSRNGVRSVYPMENFIALLDSIDIDKVQEIAIGGGETLWSAKGRDFLDYFAKRRPEKTRLSLSTNGVLLHRHTEQLLSLPQVTLTISIEGVGDSYEYIRTGAKWKTISENVLRLAMLRRHPGMRIQIASILMRSSLESVAKLLEHFQGKVDEILFMHIEGEFYQENIFMYPALLGGLEWEDPFERAISLCEADSRAHATLVLTRDTLKASYANPAKKLVGAELDRLYGLLTLDADSWRFSGKVKRYAFSAEHRLGRIMQSRNWLRSVGFRMPPGLEQSLDEFCAALGNTALAPAWKYSEFTSALKSVKGQRVVVWGVGKMYEKIVRPSLHGSNQLVSLVDGCGEKVGIDLGGVPVVSPESLTALKYDTIVIASFAYAEIFQRLAEAPLPDCTLVLPSGVVASKSALFACLGRDFIAQVGPALRAVRRTRHH